MTPYETTLNLLLAEIHVEALAVSNTECRSGHESGPEKSAGCE
jgi:hypothetical protein